MSWCLLHNNGQWVWLHVHWRKASKRFFSIWTIGCRFWEAKRTHDSKINNTTSTLCRESWTRQNISSCSWDWAELCIFNAVAATTESNAQWKTRNIGKSIFLLIFLISTCCTRETTSFEYNQQRKYCGIKRCELSRQQHVGQVDCRGSKIGRNWQERHRTQRPE